MKRILLSIAVAFYLAWNYKRNIPQCKENDDDLTNDWFI